MRLVQRFVLPFSILTLCLVVSPSRGDTVFLKNGAYIDGMVRARSDVSVEIEIGKLGKIEIPVEEIYEIEKNNRTGDEMLAKRQSKEELERIERLTREGKRKAREDELSLEGEKDSKFAPEETGVETATDATEEEEIDPELKAKIEELVADLQRQKTRYRTRAERHLRAVGAPAVPFLLPLATSESDLTRISVFRLLSEFGNEKAVQVCIAALLDANEYVRDYANKTLRRVTGEDFGFQPQASPRWREVSQEKWQKWWDDEQKALEEMRKLSGKSGDSHG